MLRLFIGIPLENGAQEQMTGYYGYFRDFKTVKKENIHITMQFLGDMEESQAESLKKAMDAACSGLTAFDISSTRISAFPHVKNAKVV